MGRDSAMNQVTSSTMDSTRNTTVANRKLARTGDSSVGSSYTANLAHWTILIVFVVIVILVVVSFWGIGKLQKKIGVKRLVRDAIGDSDYVPTIMQIYDRSTEEKCNRLIIVRPFNWHLWAINNNLYILNPQITKAICPNMSTPAIQVINDTTFQEICLKLNFTAIIDHYTNSETIEPYTFEYTIKDNTFTVLTAINWLLERNYIRFKVYTDYDESVGVGGQYDIKKVSSTDEANDPLPKRTKRSLSSRYVSAKNLNTLFETNYQNAAEPNSLMPETNTGAVIPDTDIIPQQYTQTQLLDIYRKHAGPREQQQQ